MRVMVAVQPNGKIGVSVGEDASVAFLIAAASGILQLAAQMEARKEAQQSIVVAPASALVAP
jgi:hypothetical protein